MISDIVESRALPEVLGCILLVSLLLLQAVVAGQLVSALTQPQLLAAELP